ncbi:Serine--tRNA ligase [subsurface metagenome]
MSRSILSAMITNMLDLKYIKENLQEIKENTAGRNIEADPEMVVKLYNQRNETLRKIESLRQRRNENARAMKTELPTEERENLIQEGKRIKEEIAALEQSLETVQKTLAREALKIPNLTHAEVPPGKDERDNRELKRWGEPPDFPFKPADHLQVGQNLGLIDFETAARVTGQKFYYLKNEAVLLEMALLRYAMDILKAESFTLLITPDIAREEIAGAIGFNPRGAESNIYNLEATGTCLIGTAEITLGAYYVDRMLKPEQLPIKLAGLSHCFRREAGAAGQYSRGLYRVHQFTKLEMFIFCHPEQSESLHAYLLSLEEKICQGLGIPYRVVEACAGDLGGPAYRKFDIEAWMPGRGAGGNWGEITSASNCTDYQARRLGIRFKEDGRSIFVHMLNGTAVAISRTLIAILENFQEEDGSVRIPEELVPYTGFARISPKVKNHVGSY